MVKKCNNTLKIDYKKCIVEERLLQIVNLENVNEADLVDVWAIDIEPRESRKVIDLIRCHTQDQDPINLQHIKRIKKSHDNKTLITVVASKELISDLSELECLLKKEEINYKSVIEDVKVPRIGPSTKELITEWSTKYWPINWNGNPNDQILTSYEFDMDLIKDLLGRITAKASSEQLTGNRFPIVSAFVDPKDKANVLFATDKRCNPSYNMLDHSIMRGIRKVAERQKANAFNKTFTGTTYLCVDYDVYTTHEPCSMCAMALIHSRVKRCIFIKDMPETGSLKVGSGDGYCIHSNKALNSKYEVFQWIGSEYDVPKLSKSTCT
ncbi:Tad3p KNAG_0C05880 [Huiozyma naganishii CBS 8797]|uniref:CMP/dCMP-type deaminase domain-containing protein n=1 Tax=Huiozyma naganishii (strain ATCC MYA-139 / BCRC 22969 / CBS 8797 / KCTC 17520 / NBRC 10181 / NCYC 3082 / Yp74L-3) TaxID=1071383 RepID=J7S6D1_HUIN7|nr:hypothetical protein KNAG_0C05880 [Kazachstania naganishii CBS 8797]CCK69686.1 hypothetical protein KNAG_0C05880 [Kazachstania naganishii CBS 8797]